MPRGKKVQATEPVVMPENSGDEQAEPAMVSTGAKTSGRGRPATTKGNKRGGKTVSIVEPEHQEDEDEAAEEAPAVKPLSKAAQKKKDLETAATASANSTEEVKKGRGKKATVASGEVIEVVPVEEVVAEAVVAPKKGRGRQKKEVVVAEEPNEISDAEMELAANTEEPVEKNKRGKGKKAAGTENPPVAEEAVVEEKKKRGGRTKIAATEDESADQPVVEVAASSNKKGRGKKSPQEDKPIEQPEAIPIEDNVSAEENVVAASDSKKKTGRGRKPAIAAASTASPEVDEDDKTDDLPISQAPPANIEVRKARGASRPTTPSLPQSPQAELVVEEKKGRGRTKKTPVVTPQRDAKEVPKKGARGAAAVLSQQEDAEEEEQVAEEPVEKKRGGRPKKIVEKPQPEEDAEGESSSTGRTERKRKEGGTQSQIVKKAQKQK